MTIKFIRRDDPAFPDVWRDLDNLRLSGRFSFFIVPGKGAQLKLATVRLKASKAYCGNHAKACEGVGGKHVKRVFLEGADWIEFHDAVNDILDNRGVAANVFNSAVITRKDTRRRVRYEANSFRGTRGAPNFEWVWDKDAPADHFQDCTRAVSRPSWFPHGTPGIYTALNYNEVG